MKMLLKLTLLLAMMVFCLFGFVWYRQSGIFREFEAALLLLQWMLLACLAVWCGVFLLLTFNVKDLPLIGLLLIAIAAFFIASRPALDAIMLLFGVTLGKSAFVLLRRDKGEDSSQIRSSEFGVRSFLIGLVLLLAFASWWHLEVAHNFYPGTRWTGLWNDPNDYGMLMAAGVVLTTGLLAACLKSRVQSPKSAEDLSPCSSPDGTKENSPQFQLRDQIEKPSSPAGAAEIVESRSCRPFGTRFFAFIFPPLKWRAIVGRRLVTENVSGETPDTARGARALSIVLLIVVGMMGVGLVMSYSRGAWIGAAIGLLYLAKAYGKFKWRYVLPPILAALMVICYFWNNTPDTAPWFVKRMDLSRPSAQHRVVAWRGAVQMMRDHPFGVGWNKAIETYAKNYSPPEGGAAALTMNSYLMLGTELGLPGLACFVAYIWLSFRGRAALLRGLGRGAPRPYLGGQGTARPTILSLQAACRAGALALLVAFWFDGGLFKLATAAVFWILLELGTNHSPVGPRCCAASRSIPNDQQVVPTDKQKFDYERAHC